MSELKGKKIVLGVCGGVAAYKSALLLRELIAEGARVRVVMTHAAEAFVSSLLMQALGAEDVRLALFDEQAEQGMGHIELARWADYFLIAPATANTLAKMAHGLADDLLTTIYLAVQCPVLVCPAMNQGMWAHSATQDNVALLRSRKVIFIGPASGLQACGDRGLGRMSESQEIIESLRLIDVVGCLADQRVVITAGPTQEALDPVRYLTNHSSGKMGYALARAAYLAGAEVVLISGPTALSIPDGVCHISVNSGREMYDAAMSSLQKGDIFIAAAAVADFAVAKVERNKIKKSQSPQYSIDLVLNPDIVKSVVDSELAQYVVGFAAETNNVIAYARDKLKQKKLNMVIANQVGQGLGFHVDENAVTIISKDDEVQLSMMHKTSLAAEMIAIIARNLENGA